ncbi:hypothetical protein G7046_g6175 [Stylonectria norvegica]|nr:hypothetical protein G7046_g6175 [Stylonectria norvegica]
MSESSMFIEARVRLSCEQCRKSSKQRVNDFQAQVSQLREIVDSLATQKNRRSGNFESPTINPDGESHADIRRVQLPISIVKGPVQTLTWPSTSHELPKEVLDHFVEIYRSHIYFQPLPLFEPEELRVSLDPAPDFLRQSFLAIALNFCDHYFYCGEGKKAAECYMSSARKTVMAMAAESVTSLELEVLQSLCLLALYDILGGNLSRAWMTIGTAARVQALQLVRSRGSQNSRLGSESDASRRCFWSILMLEKILSPQFVLLSQSLDPPEYPQSALRPPPVVPGGVIKQHLPDLSDAPEVNNKSCGINACCLQVISVWGDTVSYLQGLKCGRLDIPWQPSSRHAQITLSLHEIETSLSHEDLLRNVSFPDRSLTELLAHQEYWRPWVLMQIAVHAVQTILNNPFVHLVALRRAKGGVPQPWSFLQHTVDQALYHSAWVARLVQICEDLSFEIRDPLIGQLVAATATVQWMFQFTRDAAVSQKSRENFASCERLSSRLSKKWPHLARKLHVLQSLTGNSNRLDTNANDTTIMIQPEKLWELLGPSMCETISPKSSGLDVENCSPSTTLQVTSQFVHPLDDDRPHQEDEDGAPGAYFGMLGEGYEQLSLDEFFAGSGTSDFSWLPL